MDITARKAAEERQRLLLNELNHRVKNTLAIVQGLAQQSFRRQGDPQRARAAFEARLTALAAAHNLLTRNSWEPAFIAEVVEASLTAALGSDVERVDFAGPELKVPPQTAVSIALALHELSTNAIKYGALSEPGGTVRIRWETRFEGEQARFSLVWTERGGPPVRPPEARGFGSRMIEHGLAADLGGQAQLNFEPEGVVYTIDAPLPVERETADA
jgi:two-component sensor histidine kinase